MCFTSGILTDMALVMNCFFLFSFPCGCLWHVLSSTRKDDEIKRYITESIEGMFVYSFREALEHSGYIYCAITQFLDEGFLDTGNTGLKGCKLVGGRAKLLFHAWGITSVLFCSSDELFALI